MWELDNQTPYAAERTFARDSTGAEHWIVALRATFTFEDNLVTRAADQQPVRLAAEYFGDPLSTPLRYDTDVARTKQRTDVILHGTARPPRNRLGRVLDTELVVGPIRKRLRVVGERTYELLGVSSPAPFAYMPLGYERAYGGASNPHGAGSPENPVGTGARSERGSCLPNIEYPDTSVGSRGWRKPAGFGPLAPHWSPRRELAGTYDATWEATRKPLPPADFDDAFFQCAPRDQQAPGWLRGGEEVLLSGFMEEGEAAFRLPRLDLGFETVLSGRSQMHQAHLHTVILEPDSRHLALVWHTSLRCEGDLHGLRGTTVYEKTRLK